MMKCSEHTHQKIVACISSYSNEEKKRMAGMITSLGGLYSENFTNHVTVLICGVSGTPKYSAAIDAKIPIVKQEWIRESYAKGGFLPFEDYCLPPFQGLTFILLGFEDTIKTDLQRKVDKDCGKVVDEDDFGNYSSAILVLNAENAKDLYTELKVAKKTENRTIVIHEWIEACISSRQFINGSQYSCKFLFDKASIAGVPKPVSRPGYALDEEVKKLDSLQADDEKGLFLSECIVYCEKLDSADERKMQKKLIVLAGGGYFETYCKAITHVVTNSISIKNDYKENIYDYSTPPFIVVPHWLRDCIVKKCRMPEEKYKPMIAGTSEEPISFVKKPRSSAGPSSVPSTSIGTISGTSLIFKGVTFCINDTSYDSEKAQEIVRNVLKHSGTILKSTKVNYLIANDGASGNVLLDFGKVKDHSYTVVSHRWIDYCIRHKSIVSVEKNKQIYLLPLPFPSPYKEIERYSIGMTGLKTDDKLVIGRIFEAMGGKVQRDLKEATHIITDKQAATKAMEVAKKKPGVAVVDAGWLLDYMEYGVPPDNSKHSIELTK